MSKRETNIDQTLNEIDQNSETLVSAHIPELSKEQKKNKSLQLDQIEEKLLRFRKNSGIPRGKKSPSLHFSTHKKAILKNNLRSNIPRRSEVVRAAITPGEFEDADRTPMMSLTVTVILIIHCGGIITISELHKSLVRAGFYDLKKSTLSARMNNWSQIKNYFERLEGTRSGWIINTSEIENLKTDLAGIEGIDWDAIPPLNPDDNSDTE